MEQPAPFLEPPPTVDPARTSLFLDFDGTLVDLADRPESVTVSAELSRLLEKLEQRFGGRVAVVSGRSIAQLDHFLEPWSGTVALIGSHGAELRTPEAGLVAPEAPQALAEASREFARAFSSNAGVVIEVKSLGVAIHYRLDPSAEDKAMRLAAAFAQMPGLELQQGKMMVEVRSAGHDKGSGIAALMELAPFAGSAPVFLGDDLTDEPGFSRCSELGGAGILVGEPRPTAARYRLADVAAVHAWLAAQ
jgi:trehalose 6-phosphate phosphatase